MPTPSLASVFQNPFFYFDAIGESIVSIYPFIVKLSSLDIPLQTMLRLVTYAIISLIFSNWSILASVPFLNLFAIALINIAHITTSYYGFHYLHPSLAQSIFYIFPFLNLLLNFIFLGESIASQKFIMLLPILATVYYIYKQNEKNGNENGQSGLHKDLPNNPPQDVRKGIPFIIGAMVTESLLYLFIRMSDIGVNPWNNVLVTYGLAGILYAFYWFYNYSHTVIGHWEENRDEILKLVLANVIIGSFGYGLRFASIKQLPPVVYSGLSYLGIFMAVVYGLIFKLETMSETKIGGLIALFVWLIIFQII
jgi:drug/metabolite transporter (DMT)-like permease